MLSRPIATIMGLGAFVAASSGAAAQTATETIASTGDDTTITVPEGQTVRIADPGDSEGTSGIGVDNRHERVVITVGGVVETVGGNFAHAVHSAGAGADITLTGAIRTRAFRSYGIFSSAGADTEITVAEGGRIETRGAGGPDEDFTHAIRSHADRAIITVDGTILTDGILSHGIVSQGEGDTIMLSETGTIRARGPASYGIISGASGNEAGPGNARITVAGTIEVAGNPFMDIDEDGEPRTLVAFGIASDGPDSTITLTETGTIRANGLNAYGILATGADGDGDGVGTVIRVGGSILTERLNSLGILSLGQNADITVDGTIRTRGASAHGIWSGDTNPSEDRADLTGANSRITISEGGRIETQGANAHGIISQGEDSVITVDGTIRTQGAGSAGIIATGGGETITVRGGIHAADPDSHAIFGAGIRVLRLLRWDIIGRIQTGPLEELEIAEIGGHLEPSRTLRSERILGNDNPRVLGTMPVLFDLAGGTIAVLDTSAAAMQRVTTANVAQAVHGALHDRAAAAMAAPNGDGRNAGGSAAAPRTWGAVVVGGSERKTDGLALGWDGFVHGFVGGVEGTFGDGVRLGMLGGAVRSEAETEITSIEAGADTGVLGVYGELGGGAWTLTGAIMGGYSDHDTTRYVDDNVAGKQGARGDHDGIFAASSLGLKLSAPIAEGYEIRPSIRVDGLVARYGSYAEGGADTPGIAYGSWTSSSANGRAQLGLATRIDPSAEIEVRAGATSRLHSNDNVTARLVSGGNPVTYRVPGDGSVYGGFLGGRLTLAVRDGFSVAADVEYGRATGGESAYTGRVRVTASF